MLAMFYLSPMAHFISTLQKMLEPWRGRSPWLQAAHFNHRPQKRFHAETVAVCVWSLVYGRQYYLS